MVNMHEAKTQLSRLVERASKGEEIIIAKAGKPMARLVAYEPKKKRMPFGAFKGEIWIAPDFDETPQEIIDSFENSSL